MIPTHEIRPGLTSVIVTCRDDLAATQTCLKALNHATHPPWELIVVHAGDSEATAAYLAGLRDASPARVEVLSSPARRDQATLRRLGLDAAQGEFVAFVDPEAIVTDGWLDHLLALCRASPAIGLTAPMLPVGPPEQRVDAAEVRYTDRSGLHAFASAWRSRHRGQWLRTGRIAGQCLLVRRTVLDAIGHGKPVRAAYLHPKRLAARTKACGFDLAIARDLFVHVGNGRAVLAESSRHTPCAVSKTATCMHDARVATESDSEQRHTECACSRRRARVALLMIVRDEQENLPACLESVKGLFDDLVIIDTGSKDQTREIARSFGARVFDFPWVDDFSAARNAALAPARGKVDYGFSLDGDDRFEPGERAKLQALLDSLSPDDQAAYVLRCRCDPDEEGGGGETVVDHIRLFPVREDVFWTYRVHEQILPSIRRAGVPVRWTEITVRHTGYARRAVRARKLERDERILREELAERPDDPFVLFNLGSIAVERDQWPEALAHLHASLARSAPSDSIVRKLYALIARCHERQGEPAAALAACDMGLAIDPDDAELLFRQAVILRGAGDRAGAEACWRRVMSLRRPEKWASVDQGIYTHLPRRNLAVLAAERGDLAEALRLWHEVLAECPGDRAALEQIKRLTEERRKEREGVTA